MKVLLLSTYEHTGGAAIAASRLLHALQGQGVEATMLCRRNIRAGWLRRLCPPLGRALEKQSWTSIMERLVIWIGNGFSKKDLWATDIALFGQDITRTKEYQEADVVHLHWVNQGFLSLSTIGKIARSGKKVVWTMHDEWPLDGIEHYTNSSPTPSPPLGEGGGKAVEPFITRARCPRPWPWYSSSASTHTGTWASRPRCRSAAQVQAQVALPHSTCPIPLRGGRKVTGENALSRWVMKRKAEIYRCGNITFVTCSKWLREISEKKPLAQGQRVVDIPNPIDTSLFAPLTAEQREEAATALGLPRGKKVVLFVAQKVDDERKGIRYLDEAVRMLMEETAGAAVPTDQTAPESDIAVVAPGRDIPYINKVEDMARLYAAVDVFVTPSLSDNLPNTIMEAMACGTPCVGFNVGGIPEMIDHKGNGYVARYKDAKDLAEGIRYAIAEENHARLSAAAREKVLRCYSEEAVARRYIAEYGL